VSGTGKARVSSLKGICSATASRCRSTRLDEVGIGELGRLSDLLGALYAQGRIEHPLELYLTEYGYETNPPDPTRGVNPRAQARYLGLATFLAWQRPDVRMFPQFLVRDIGPDLRFGAGTAARWRGFQTGLLDFRGRAKPAARAFVMPFWAYRDGADIVIFGQVRPGGGGHAVRIERQSASGRWGNLATRPATTASGAEELGFVTDAEGFFVRRSRRPSACVSGRGGCGPCTTSPPPLTSSCAEFPGPVPPAPLRQPHEPLGLRRDVLGRDLVDEQLRGGVGGVREAQRMLDVVGADHVRPRTRARSSPSDRSRCRFRSAASSACP